MHRYRRAKKVRDQWTPGTRVLRPDYLELMLRGQTDPDAARVVVEKPLSAGAKEVLDNPQKMTQEIPTHDDQ
jgi:hypothetical protein